MVDEDERAWHAGLSYWRGITDVNSASIGIELVNPGHEWGYRPFPEEQIAALIPLMHGIVRRHRITRGTIVAHSAPAQARQPPPRDLFPPHTLPPSPPAPPPPPQTLTPPP